MSCHWGCQPAVRPVCPACTGGTRTVQPPSALFLRFAGRTHCLGPSVCCSALLCSPLLCTWPRRCSPLSWLPPLSPCRERERREKEREEWERQYSRQSRSPSPRYSECPAASGLLAGELQSHGGGRSESRALRPAWARVGPCLGKERRQTGSLSAQQVSSHSTRARTHTDLRRTTEGFSHRAAAGVSVACPHTLLGW